MRAFRLALLVAVLSFAAPLFARSTPVINAITPNAVHIENGEWFVEIDGAHFLPTSGMQVSFTGPAGTYNTNALTATDSVLFVWVPGPPLLSPGNYSVTVKVPDGFGGTLVSNPVNFTVLGRIVWFINLPAILAAEAQSLDGSIVRFGVSAQSLYSDVVTVDCDHKSGEFFAFGRTSVTCTATDDLGFGTKTGFTVDVEDTTPPTIKTPVDLNAFGSADGGAVKYDVSASDTVDTALLPPTCTPDSGSFFRVGTTTVTCTSSDRFKNTASSAFRIHLGTDTGVPALTVPLDMKVEAASLEGEFVKYAASAVDFKGNVIDTRCDPPSGSLFPIGTTTVKCVASGALTATETFNVTVADTTGPAISVPADMTVQAADINGAFVKYDVSASDKVDGAMSVSCSPLSGDLFPAGDTTVNCSSTDKSRNTSIASFVVHVTPWFDDTVYSIGHPTSGH